MSAEQAGARVGRIHDLSHLEGALQMARKKSQKPLA